MFGTAKRPIDVPLVFGAREGRLSKMDRRARGALQASAEADSKGAGPAGRSISYDGIPYFAEVRVNATSSRSLFFPIPGNVVFANMAACREFAHRMNQVRDVEKHPERAVHAGATLRHGPDRRGQPRADGALPRAVRSRGDDRRAGLVLRAGGR